MINELTYMEYLAVLNALREMSTKGRKIDKTIKSAYIKIDKHVKLIESQVERYS